MTPDCLCGRHAQLAVLLTAIAAAVADPSPVPDVDTTTGDLLDALEEATTTKTTEV